MRQLVTVREVRELIPIEGADRIELARVDGWQCVVKKGDFVVGDNALYFEIDSILPPDERFAFLEQRKYRIKSMKLRGALSQGLLMPLEATLTKDEKVRMAFGESLQEIIGVKKFEPPMPMGGKQKGTFPTHLVPKTDQERIQNIPEVLEGKRDNMFEITEKLDGTSCTFFVHVVEGDVLGSQLVTGVCSRNWEMQILDGNVYAKLFHELGIHDKLRHLGGRQLAIQGEIIGPSIQKNRYKRDAQEFYVFDMYDISAQKPLSPMERWKLTNELDLFHVPVVYWSGLSQGEHMMLTLDNVLAEAEGKSALSDTQREGLVFKSLDASLNFKAISNKFLLKNE